MNYLVKKVIKLLNSTMRTIWIREVRYYKYMMLLCGVLFVSACILLNEYNKQETNIGAVINIQYIYNASYIIPIYKVKTNNTIYNVYDDCVITNITSCSTRQITINFQVYFEKINNMYIIRERNHFPLYFSAFAFTFGILMVIIISFAYIDFYRLRRREYKMWSKQKKYDVESGECVIKSFLYD